MSDLLPDHDVLTQRYVEGLLSEAEAAVLHEQIVRRPELARLLLDHLEMDAMLGEVAAAETTVSVPMASVPASRRRFSMATLAGVAGLAACLTLAGTFGVKLLLPSRALANKASAADEATTASVALLSRGVNLQWESGSPAPVEGTPLAPGLLRLKSGLAQIEFYRGARVLIEGPAEFQLVSSGEATCTKGKLSAHVPPQAKGFRINTPKGTIVDLGTEFGLDVGAADSEVHVFKGEVELHTASAAMQSLKEGQAMAFASIPRELTANPAAFSTLNELDARTLASQRSLFQAWQQQGARWNADPALRIRFDFQDAEDSRALQNHAEHGRSIPDGSIVGGAWTQGRWANKRALEFRNVSDRVRLSVPGETEALTMSLWVRVNGLDRAYNSLFMSEGWGDRRVHWQIVREGRVRLGVAGQNGQRHTDFDGPVLFTPERFGRWMHLAVVFDPIAKEVRHYADGVLSARLPVRDFSPLKIGVAELGNWNDRIGERGVAIRHLSGAMDDFALFARVLSDAEIASLAK
jgi:ferric-dicitrate binding protein FerR (iron transport regulator)